MNATLERPVRPSDQCLADQCQSEQSTRPSKQASRPSRAKTELIPEGTRGYSLTTEAAASDAAGLIARDLGSRPDLRVGDVVFVAPDAQGRCVEPDPAGVRVYGRAVGYYCCEGSSRRRSVEIAA